MTHSGRPVLGIVQNDNRTPIPPVASAQFGAVVRAMRRRDFIKVIAGSIAARRLVMRAKADIDETVQLVPERPTE
jgi:hypothetical protein